MCNTAFLTDVVMDDGGDQDQPEELVAYTDGGQCVHAVARGGLAGGGGDDDLHPDRVDSGEDGVIERRS